MTLFNLLFFAIAALIVGSTALAITRRNLVHAVIYLIFGFFGSAFLFYLFGSPFLAALMVILYARAILILFLFIIMMLRTTPAPPPDWPRPGPSRLPSGGIFSPRAGWPWKSPPCCCW